MLCRNSCMDICRNVSVINKMCLLGCSHHPAILMTLGPPAIHQARFSWHHSTGNQGNPQKGIAKLASLTQQISWSLAIKAQCQCSSVKMDSYCHLAAWLFSVRCLVSYHQAGGGGQQFKSMQWWMCLQSSPPKHYLTSDPTGLSSCLPTKFRFSHHSILSH